MRIPIREQFKRVITFSLTLAGVAGVAGVARSAHAQTGFTARWADDDSSVIVGTSPSGEWFRNTREARSYYDRDADRNGFTDLVRILGVGDRAERMLDELRRDEPLCEERILANWQRELGPKVSVETLLFWMRSQNRIDDLVLRAFLSVHRAYADGGIFPPLDRVSLGDRLPLEAFPLNSEALPPPLPQPPATASREEREAFYAALGARSVDESSDDQIVFRLHFEGCASKIVRRFAAKRDNDPAEQKRSSQAFYERLRALAVARKIPTAITERLADLESLDARELKRGLGSSALTLDSIREVATGKSWPLGRLSAKPGIARGAYVTLQRRTDPGWPDPKPSYFLSEPSHVDGFSERQWIYEIAARTKVDAIGIHARRWKDYFDLSSTSMTYAKVWTDAVTGEVKYRKEQSTLAQGVEALNGYFVQVQDEFHTGARSMQFEAAVASGFETGALRDEDFGPLLTHLKVLAKIKYIEERKTSPVVEAALRYAPTVGIVVGGAVAPYITGAVTLIRFLQSNPGKFKREDARVRARARRNGR